MRFPTRILSRRVARNCFSIFLLAVQAVFLNLIVPGHTRGVITLSGKTKSVSLADLGCPFCSHRSSDDPKKSPTGKERSQCAICQMAICMMSQPPIDFGLGELGLLKLISPPPSEKVADLQTLRTYYGRGPPSLSV